MEQSDQTIVVDPSLIFQWYFSADDDSALEDLPYRLTQHRGFTPPNWWYDIRDLALRLERRHKTDAADTSGLLEDLAALPLQSMSQGSSERILALARKYTLSATEASYLELATRTQSVLLTQNSALLLAAKAENIETRFT